MTPSHHPVFEKFNAFQGEAAAGHDRDFIGSSIAQAFFAVPRRDSTIRVTSSHPSFDEEYFEWIDVLESVIEARDSYTMIELGAGYGRWAVRAALAVQQYSQMPFHLIAVEAEPVHFEWLHGHFRTNGLDPGQHILIPAAVGATTGAANFYIGSPHGNDAPDQWYGQALVTGAEATKAAARETYAGHQVRRHPNGFKSISVPQVSMRSLLRGRERVDLIDLDVQGEELNAIASAIADVDHKVKRIHIGTHGAEIEAGLRTLLVGHDWRCLNDYGCGEQRETPYGTISFGDGVQTWVNPRLT